MYLKLLKNDFRKNPWNNAILFLFMCLSAAIAVIVTLMLSQLFTAISSMYETANPPHFLQMHKGELVQADIDEFNRAYDGIEHWQTSPMLNFYGDEITVSKENGEPFTLAECRLDISFVKQNGKYDVLLDRNRNRLEADTGEIGVPVILLDQFDISVGDRITLTSGELIKTFTVSSYVYDGQMNSTLCSSTRFLVSDEDYDQLSGSAGETEYLIEAWFSDSSQAADYQTAYEQSGLNLPRNGQAITYTMIFLLSALTDLFMAMVFLLTGVLLIVIALVCLRYAILAELEEDMREIGTMKAMGIPEKGISSLYLGKIRILAAGGCVLGFVLARLMVSLLTGHISRTFGNRTPGFPGYGLAALVCAAVYGIILLFSGKVLQRMGQASVTELLVTEKGFGHQTKVRDGLRRAKRLPVNVLLGLHEVRKGYGIVFGLLLLVSFLTSIPFRTVQTIEHEEFAAYMGSPVSDLLLEVEQSEELEEKNHAAKNLLQAMLQQGNAIHIDAMRRVRLQAVGKNGEMAGIHIDTGENAGAGLQYLVGQSPETGREIALSYLMSDELEKTAGDTVSLKTGDKIQEFTVCGIYQDVTSGGRTAKTVCAFPQEPAEKYSYGITLPPAANAAGLAAGMRERLGNGYSIENMEEFLRQTLGGVTTQIRQASYAVLLIGICLTMLITALFLKLRIARESAALTAKKAMGIPFAAILKQELYPVLLAGGIGSLCGVLFAELFGDGLISILFGILGIGLKKIIFVQAPVRQLFIIPAILLVTLSVITVSICMPIKRLEVSGHINE